MLRALGLPRLLATGGLVAAVLVASGRAPHLGAETGDATGSGGLAIDPASFAAGVLAALTGVWLRRLPWQRFVEAVGALLRTWRRNAALLIMAAVFAGILLFY